jgi:nitrate reductase NapD
VNICGILVHIHPQEYPAMRERLQSIPGVEVHGLSDEGRTVVTLEEDDEDRMAESMFAIQKTEGVLSASMIYHHREDEATESELKLTREDSES